MAFCDYFLNRAAMTDDRLYFIAALGGFFKNFSGTLRYFNGISVAVRKKAKTIAVAAKNVFPFVIHRP